MKRAHITVTRKSNGEKVVLYLEAVDRMGRRVVIDIPQSPYNTRFTFSDVDGEIEGKVSLVSGGRQPIDKGNLATSHVSQTVYVCLVRWAGSILNNRR